MADHFAADAHLASLGAAHHTARGRDDRDPEAAEDARNVARRGVDPQPWLTDPLDAAHDRLVLADVAQLDLQLPGRALAHLRVPLDVALVLQDLGDGRLDLGGWHLHGGVTRLEAVSNAGQHIRDRISHHGVRSLLPAGLRDARDLAFKRELPE